MKAILPVIAAAVTLVLSGCSSLPEPKALKPAYSSFDLPSEHPASDAAALATYEAKDLQLSGVLDMYEHVSARTVIAGPLPAINLTFRSATQLTRIEALQMLDTILAQNQVAMVLSGDKVVKAVPAMKVATESPPEISLPWRLLPQSSSPMSRTVHLQYLKPSQVVAALQPLAGLPNSILPIDSQQILVLRDYSSNIRQELKLLEELDTKTSSK